MYYPYKNLVIDGSKKRIHAFGHASYALAKAYTEEHPEFAGIDYSADQVIWTADVVVEQVPDIEGIVTSLKALGLSHDFTTIFSRPARSISKVDVPIGEDVKIRFLPPSPKFEDHHISLSTKNWKPDDTFQAIGRIRRKKFVPKIVRVGRYYTHDELAASAPRSLKFNTRRAAKRFFSNTVFVTSQQQLVSMFSKAEVPRMRVQVLKERPQSNHSDTFWIKRNFADMKFADWENPNV